MTEKYIQKIEKDIDNDFKFLKSDIINLIDLKELETANANYDCFKDEVYKQIYILILYNFFQNNLEEMNLFCKTLKNNKNSYHKLSSLINQCEDNNRFKLFMYLSNNDTIKVIVEQLIKEDCIFEKSLIKEDIEDSLIEYISFYCTINSIPYIDIIPTRSNDLINDIAKVYLQEISKIPLLSSEDELSLTTSYIKTRDKDIRDKIIESNLKLVVNVAKKNIDKGLEFIDLIGEGNIGLMKAVERFDPSMGFKFATYATWWINQSIQRAIKNQSRNIRIPVAVVEKMQKYLQTIRKITEKEGRVPSDQEMANTLNVPLEKILEYKRLLNDTISLSEIVKDSNNKDIELIETIEDKSNILVYNNFTEKGELEEALKKMPIKEATVLRLRYGLNPEQKCYSQNQIAKIYPQLGLSQDKVTHQRISQLEIKGLQKLKDIITAKPKTKKTRTKKSQAHDHEKIKKPQGALKNTDIKMLSFLRSCSGTDIKVIEDFLGEEELAMLKKYFGDDLANPVLNRKTNYEDVLHIKRVIFPKIYGLYIDGYIMNESSLVLKRK